MNDWDDIRYFLAVARAGTLAGAATALGVNHSTVFRRVNALEARMGARLFERRRDGYGLTPAGIAMRDSANRIEAEMQALDRRVTGEDVRLTGAVRVTAPDDMAALLLPPVLARFREAYPGIMVELAISNRFLNLSRRDADVALRPSRQPGDLLVGRRIADVAFAVYRVQDRFEEPDALETAPVVTGDDTTAHTASVQWTRAHADPARIALRADSMSARLAAVAAGIGIGALPCFIADPNPGLVRLTDLVPEMANELWLLTHPDLRGTARVRAFMEIAGDALVGERDLLEGARGRPPQAA